MANTHGMTAAQVVAAAYNGSKPIPETGPGWLQYIPGDLSQKEAEEVAAKALASNGGAGFSAASDYLHGRPMKLKLDKLAEGFVDEAAYDMRLGAGKLQGALDYFHQRLQASGGKWPVGL